MEIKPPPPDDDGFLAGPYLQNVTRNSIVVMWETHSGHPGLLEYGSDRTYGKSQTSLPRHTKAGSYIHKVKLESLETETVYYYRVTTNGSTTADARFRTAPATDTPFRFVVWGDNQLGVDTFQTLVSRMADYSPDLLLSVGDLVQRGSDYPQWRDQYFDPIRETASHIPVFAAPGNHDYLDRDNYWFSQYFSAPGHGHYFSFDYGNSHFIFVDNCDAHTRYGYRPFAVGSRQYEWLAADLQSPESRCAAFRFAFLHVPPYSRATWGGEEDTRRDLVPLFESHGVDLVFSGHHHLYEQGRWPPAGWPSIRYVVTGGGGGGLKGESNDPAANPWPQVQENIAAHHFCLIEIKDRCLDFKAIDADGNVLDAFSVGDSAPLPPDNIRVAPIDGANQLCWQPNHLGDSKTFAGVTVYRSRQPHGEFKQIARLSNDTHRYIDKSLTNGSVYYYRLAANDTVLGEGPRSEAAIGVPRVSGDLANHAFHQDILGDFVIVDKSTDAAAPSIWSSSDGKLCQFSQIGTANGSWDGTFALVDIPTPGNLTLDVDVQNLATGACGLVFRYIDRQNYYQFRWDAQNDACNIEKVTAADPDHAVVLKNGWAEVGAFSEDPYHLRLILHDDQLSVLISGGHLASPVTLSTTDPTHSHGKVGLYCWSSNLIFFEHLSVAAAGRMHPDSVDHSQWSVRDDFSETKLDPSWLGRNVRAEIATPTNCHRAVDTPALQLTVEAPSAPPRTGGGSGTLQAGSSVFRNGSVQARVHCEYNPLPVTPLHVQSGPGSDALSAAPVVISQIHTGRYGFVELHNRIDTDVVLENWSLQCSPRLAEYWCETQGDVLVLNIRIRALGYYLVGATKRYTLETAVPDKIWVEALNAEFSDAGATVALVCAADLLQPGVADDDPAIVDLVGWGRGEHLQFRGPGPAPTPAAHQSIIRKATVRSSTESMSDDGAEAMASHSFDTHNNAADFVIRQTPFPRNAQRPPDFCGAGIFLREDGSGHFVDGNCYYLVWDPAIGSFHAGKSIGGRKIDFMPTKVAPRFQASAWRRLRIDADHSIISYWIDDSLFARVIDHSFHVGFCGIGVRSSEKEKPNYKTALFDGFAASAD
jgi:hypothetical protein